MQVGKRKISGSLALLLILVMLVSAVAGTLLYSLTRPATWRVNVATGLELDYPNGTAVTALSFTVDPLGSQTQSFVLKNLANHAVNVTDVIPDSTSLYTFGTTFANSTLATPNTIAQNGSYNFTITLTDINMDSTATYSGSFAYNIVTAGPSQGSSNDTFGTSTAAYSSDTSQYFKFVSDNFDASSYPVGNQVVYTFVTRNINQTYEIQGLSYKLEIFDATNNLVATVCDGLLVAYYQNSTAYGTFGNGTHMTDSPLLPNETITIWNSFSAPSPAQVYHAVLTYQSHNAAPVPPPSTPISWTISINTTNGNVRVENPTNGSPDPALYISGATQTGEAGSISVKMIDNVGNGISRLDFTVTIPSLSITLGTVSGATLNPNQSRIYTFAIPALSTGGSLTAYIHVTWASQ